MPLTRRTIWVYSEKGKASWHKKKTVKKDDGLNYDGNYFLMRSLSFKNLLATLINLRRFHEKKSKKELLVTRTFAHTLKSPKFFNILEMQITIQYLQLRLWKWGIMLVCEMLGSPDTLWVQFVRFASMVCSTTLSSYWDSCDSSEISWTIWWLYWDQLHFHLLHNKCLWSLLWHYHPVWTHKA